MRFQIFPWAVLVAALAFSCGENAQNLADAGTDGAVANSNSDSGVSSDGGFLTDGGTLSDGGVLADGGTQSDAGVQIDGGAPSDGGVQTDGGVATPKPVQISSASDGHVCARFDNGKIKCWGHNTTGQLGIGDANNRGDGPGEMGNALPYVDLGTGRTAVHVAAGNGLTCAVLDNAQLKCWGFINPTTGDGPNEMGDNLPYVALGVGRTATAVVAGDSFACAILDNGAVRCWGSNQAAINRVGNTQFSDATSHPTLSLGVGRTALALSAEEGTICALLDNHQVKCWGNNASGQLGNGQPGAVGETSNHLTDSSPGVDLGTGMTAAQVSVSGNGACARLTNGNVKCWGSNAYGNLGLGISDPNRGLTNDMGDLLPVLNLGTGRTTTHIESGGCALLDNAKVKCWGYNGTGGYLGLGDTINRGLSASDMGDNLPAVNLGTGRTAKALTAGDARCVILDNDAVKCWGSSAYGELGQGNTAPRGAAAGDMGDNLPAIKLFGP